MNTFTFFVSETYIKTITALSANIDVNQIMPFVGTYQDMYIQDTLGSNFMDYLLNAYSAQTLNTDEIELVTKIKPALAWGAADMCLPSLTYRATPKGPQLQFGDNSTQITIDEFKYLRNEFRAKSEFYMERLKTYLCANANLFPQYVTNNTTDLSPNSQTAYNCDIYFARPSSACSSCGGNLPCNCHYC